MNNAYGVPGLRVIRNVITPEQRRELLAIPVPEQSLSPIPDEEWEARFVWHYQEHDLAPESIQYVWDLTAELVGMEVKHAMFNEYQRGYRLAPHSDGTVYGIDAVAVLSLGAADMHMRHGYAHYSQVSFRVPSRAVLVMQGPAFSTWEHGIPRITRKRRSLVMRGIAREDT